MAHKFLQPNQDKTKLNIWLNYTYFSDSFLAHNNVWEHIGLRLTCITQLSFDFRGNAPKRSYIYLIDSFCITLLQWDHWRRVCKLTCLAVLQHSVVWLPRACNTEAWVPSCFTWCTVGLQFYRLKHVAFRLSPQTCILALKDHLFQALLFGFSNEKNIVWNALVDTSDSVLLPSFPDLW